MTSILSSLKFTFEIAMLKRKVPKSPNVKQIKKIFIVGLATIKPLQELIDQYQPNTKEEDVGFLKEFILFLKKRKELFVKNQTTLSL